MPRAISARSWAGGLGIVAHQHGLGDLELEPFGREAGLGERGVDLGDEAGLVELQRRDVDREVERARGQALARASAVRSAQRPIGRIRPVASASGMKAAGGSSPRSGWRQRSSASTPLTRPVARST